MRTTARNESGFTLIEIMVSMALLVIGLLGILALQMTTVKGNRLSRQLERAKVYAAEYMEDLRSQNLKDSTFPLAGAKPDALTSDGVTYRRAYDITSVTGSDTLRLITITVSFYENDDPDEEHKAVLQMLRTTEERM